MASGTLNLVGTPSREMTTCPCDETTFASSPRSAAARACLYEDDTKNGLVLAVRETIDGGRPMSHGMAPLLLEHIRTSARRSSAVRPAVRPLTERERVLLGHMAQGLGYDEVGTALGVSVNTVRSFIRAIYEKLDVGSRTEAVLLAIKLGIVKGTPVQR